MTTVALIRRTAHHPLCHPDSQRIDFARVAAHFDHLRAKHGVQERSSPTQASGNTHPTLFARIRQAVTSTSAKSKTGTLKLIDRGESLWYGLIQLGDSTIRVDFDTGSEDLIVNKSAYTPSSTAKKLGQRFQVGFGDATNATGDVYTDTLHVAGIKADGVAFGWADSDYVDADEGDQGIAGMAFTPMAFLKQPPFFDALMNAGLLKENMFTFRLRHNEPTLTLGGIPDDVTATPTYVPVDASQGFWASPATINGIAVKAIQDSGTTLIAMSVAMARQLFAKLALDTYEDKGALYAYLPTRHSKPPAITIAFGSSFERALSPETTTFGHDDQGCPVLSIVGIDLGVDGVLFGDAWLRNVVAVFSRKDKQPKLGFVAQQP